MDSLRRKVPVWPEPKQLKSDLLPVEEFDQELLPTPFRDFVADTSFRMDSSPLDYIGIAVMVAAASLIGGKVHIKPKENDNWRAARIVLPFYQDGQKVTYCTDDLDDYLASKRVEPIAYGYPQAANSEDVAA